MWATLLEDFSSPEVALFSYFRYDAGYGSICVGVFLKTWRLWWASASSLMAGMVFLPPVLSTILFLFFIFREAVLLVLRDIKQNPYVAQAILLASMGSQ